MGFEGRMDLCGGFNGPGSSCNIQISMSQTHKVHSSNLFKPLAQMYQSHNVQSTSQISQCTIQTWSNHLIFAFSFNTQCSRYVMYNEPLKTQCYLLKIHCYLTLMFHSSTEQSSDVCRQSKSMATLTINKKANHANILKTYGCSD